MRILVFGDVMGRIGRIGISRVLPMWKRAHAPTLTVANVENLAHGTGITERCLRELLDAGVEAFPSGNHIFDNQSGLGCFSHPDFSARLVRPLNYPAQTIGRGFTLLQTPEGPVGLCNLLGRVFLSNDPPLACPFKTFDTLMDRPELAGIPILVDFHAEATSEKNSFALYADGRAAAVWGTHSHVPTADHRILPRGTASVTDVGMTGGMNGSIGAFPGPILESFLTGKPPKIEPIPSGACEINAILITIEETRAVDIQRLREIVEVE